MIGKKQMMQLVILGALGTLSAGCSDMWEGDGDGGGGGGNVHAQEWTSSHGEEVVAGDTDCTKCHGDSFEGARGPACTECHAGNGGPLAGDPALAALEFGASDGSPLIDHPADWESLTVEDETIPFYTFSAARHGYVAKADDWSGTRPVGFGVCADCHGTGFIGLPLPPPLPGDSADCLACHGNDTPHSPDLAEWAEYHHITTSPTNAPVCAECHAGGDNSPLEPPPPDPSVANGCFNGSLCHTGDIVTTPIVNHFENHWEFHQRNPEACMICHGEDFQGRGEAPACFRCHDGSTAPECTTCHLLELGTGGALRASSAKKGRLVK